jgi:GH25 family lysozyme M1 (1,4-beta-N-acetylmuramidase)
MIPARVVDIHSGYRTGGVDWPRARLNLDAIIYRAGIGFWRDELIDEHTSWAERVGIPRATYWIPNCLAGPMEIQTRHYIDDPRVKGAPVIIDVEAPNRQTRCINYRELDTIRKTVEDRLGRKPWFYTRMNIISTSLAWVAWVKDYPLWIAQYPTWWGQQATKFETHLSRYPTMQPPSVKGTIYAKSVVLWQFTEKGDAPYYLANKYTNDKIYKTGIKSADLNISTIEREQFLKLFLL